MLRKFGAAVVAAGLMAAAAQAEDYSDPKGGFRVTIPEGWTRTVSAEDGDLTVNSPNDRQTFGFCWVHFVPLPGTEGMTQAQIDERLAGKFTPSFWKKLFEGEPSWKNLTVMDSGEEVQNGRNTYYAVVTYKYIRRSHKFKTVVHFLPGESYHLTCNAYLEAYAREEAAFETFFDSFVPVDRGLIAKVTKPSVALSSASPAGIRADAVAQRAVQMLRGGR